MFANIVASSVLGVNIELLIRLRLRANQKENKSSIFKSNFLIYFFTLQFQIYVKKTELRKLVNHAVQTKEHVSFKSSA